MQGLPPALAAAGGGTGMRAGSRAEAAPTIFFGFPLTFPPLRPLFPGEKALRRDPRSGIYTGIACPDMKKVRAWTRGRWEGGARGRGGRMRDLVAPPTPGRKLSASAPPVTHTDARHPTS